MLHLVVGRDHCFLLVADFLAIRSAPLLQRQLVNRAGKSLGAKPAFQGEISACALWAKCP